MYTIAVMTFSCCGSYYSLSARPWFVAMLLQQLLCPSHHPGPLNDQAAIDML